MMPNSTGRGMKIRAINWSMATHRAGAKIVMTTAMGDARNVLAAFDSQCEGYLVKPITPQALEKQLIELQLVIP